MSVLPATFAPPTDNASREWLLALRAEGATRDEAVARLHALLLRAARFEAARRRGRQAHLDDFRGESRFTTWVYKFALLETAVKLRKRAWQGREVPLEPDTWSLLASVGLAPDEQAEQSELLSTVQTAICEVLTPHQRRVLVALTLNGVPIDVLADRLDTTRGALYKTLHDARCKLRAHLAERDLSVALAR
jgi:RNA polymerase sigma-70 factor (ECF subfamily)